MKSNIVREVDIQKVAEFLVNQEKEKLLKEEKEKEKEKEKPDDIQSLELLLGMKIIALWVDNIEPDGIWNNSLLNIRCLEEKKQVEMTMVWQFKELKDFNPLDFVPEGSK
jgi:hypothetical protein